MLRPTSFTPPPGSAHFDSEVTRWTSTASLMGAIAWVVFSSLAS